MKDKPPGHNWTDAGNIIFCKDCGQTMFYVTYLDPKSTDKADAVIFDKYKLKHPVYNTWVMCGWAVIHRHPLNPVDCQEEIARKNMHAALS